MKKEPLRIEKRTVQPPATEQEFHFFEEAESQLLYFYNGSFFKEGATYLNVESGIKASKAAKYHFNLTPLSPLLILLEARYYEVKKVPDERFMNGYDERLSRSELRRTEIAWSSDGKKYLLKEGRQRAREVFEPSSTDKLFSGIGMRFDWKSTTNEPVATAEQWRINNGFGPFGFLITRRDDLSFWSIVRGGEFEQRSDPLPTFEQAELWCLEAAKGEVERVKQIFDRTFESLSDKGGHHG